MNWRPFTLNTCSFPTLHLLHANDQRPSHNTLSPGLTQAGTQQHSIVFQAAQAFCSKMKQAVGQRELCLHQAEMNLRQCNDVTTTAESELNCKKLRERLKRKQAKVRRCTLRLSVVEASLCTVMRSLCCQSCDESIESFSLFSCEHRICVYCIRQQYDQRKGEKGLQVICLVCKKLKRMSVRCSLQNGMLTLERPPLLMELKAQFVDACKSLSIDVSSPSSFSLFGLSSPAAAAVHDTQQLRSMQFLLFKYTILCLEQAKEWAWKAKSMLKTSSEPVHDLARHLDRLQRDACQLADWTMQVQDCLESVQKVFQALSCNFCNTCTGKIVPLLYCSHQLCENCIHAHLNRGALAMQRCPICSISLPPATALYRIFSSAHSPINLSPTDYTQLVRPQSTYTRKIFDFKTVLPPVQTPSSSSTKSTPVHTTATTSAVKPTTKTTSVPPFTPNTEKEDSKSTTTTIATTTTTSTVSTISKSATQPEHGIQHSEESEPILVSSSPAPTITSRSPDAEKDKENINKRRRKELTFHGTTRLPRQRAMNELPMQAHALTGLLVLNPTVTT